MNPYIIVAVMLVIDLVSIPFFIRSMLKKNIRNKGAAITLLLVAFIAVEAAFSVFYINANRFYDREGNIYTSAEDVIYHDREGNEYTLYPTKADHWHFISTDSRYTYIAERVYVDKDGYIVYDRENKIKETDLKYVYADDEGNEYYRADEIRFDSKGSIRLKNSEKS
ncbi:MAG: hypothetical protein IIU80_07830 [Clostridia bacterium]|nr:hypothetical protein [Clostridia bacterium]